MGEVVRTFIVLFILLIALFGIFVEIVSLIPSQKTNGY